MASFSTGTLFLLATTLAAQTPTLPELTQAAKAIAAENVLRHIRVLSSDEFAGRFPGTPGETKSVAYLLKEIKAAGLAPGTPTGTYIQKVPLNGIQSRGTITLESGSKPIPMAARQDFILWSNLPDAKVEVPQSNIVFAGYGAIAPEYNWNDYAGIDVRGKIVLILSGDPPTSDESLFQGKALSVYGRAGTKYDTAFRQGAAAVFMISNATPLSLNNARENMTLRDANDRKFLRAQALISPAKATELLSNSGHDLVQLRLAASKPGFRAIPLNARAAISISSKVRRFFSQNIFAKIEGSDPALKNEYVVYSAHWDHHGQDGKDIFHGASDNAAGSSGILEIARALKTLSPAPKRTILFFWTTGEEKGLLGAKYYVENPLYPIASTIANINLDYFSNWGWGRTRDFSIVGLGNSTLDDLTAEAVARQGRTLTGDTAPEQGFYFRSDHYEFGRIGVPSLETAPGIDYIGKPSGYGIAKRNEYIKNDYHQVSDVIKPDWDLSGAIEDLQVVLEVGYRAAQLPTRPAWKPDAKWRPK